MSYFHFLLLPEGCSVKPRNVLSVPYFLVLIVNDLEMSFLRQFFSAHSYFTHTQTVAVRSSTFVKKQPHFLDAYLFIYFKQKRSFGCCHDSQTLCCQLSRDELLMIFVQDIISKHTHPPGEGNRALIARAITVLGTQGCACLLIPPMGKDLDEPAICLGSSSAAKDPNSPGIFFRVT